MKKINIRVIPNARQNKIIEEPGRLKVYVNTPPVDGSANRAVIKLLADFFNIKRSKVNLIKGDKTRDKLVEIDM